MINLCCYPKITALAIRQKPIVKTTVRVASAVAVRTMLLRFGFMWGFLPCFDGYIITYPAEIVNTFVRKDYVKRKCYF